MRWLVAGGGAAGQVHVAAIERTPRATLAGVVDPFAPADFKDLATALRQAKPDAIVIAAPNDCHLALAMEAIDSGIPVLCEKPVGRRVSDALRILDYAAGKNVAVGVVLNQRTYASTRWVRGLIAAGTAEARAVSFSGAVPRLTRWHTDTARSGGGVLRTIAIHALDLLVWWLGEPTEVEAKLGGGHPETVVSVTGRFAGDRIGSVNISAIADTGMGPVRCIIDGEHNRVVIDGHRVTDYRGLPAPPEAEPFDPSLKYGPGHLNLIGEATETIAENGNFPISLAEALPTLKLIEQIYIGAGRLLPVN